MNDTDKKKMAKAVRTGAKLLDRHHKGWFKKIVMKRLAMEDCSACILGQLTDQFSEAVTSFWPDVRYPTRGLLIASHGFDIDHSWDIDAVEAYEELRQLWIEAIRARKTKAKAA